MHIILIVELYLIPSTHDDSTDYSHLHLHQVTHLSLILYYIAVRLRRAQDVGRVILRQAV